MANTKNHAKPNPAQKAGIENLGGKRKDPHYKPKTVKVATVEEVDRLKAIEDDAYTALNPTRRTCEGCGSRLLPNDTPEYAAWATALAATDAAAIDCILDDQIGVPEAVSRWQLGPRLTERRVANGREDRARKARIEQVG